MARVTPAEASGASAAPKNGVAERTDVATALATAIIPARGGSKGLPGKNVARVGGVPLVARAVRAALAAERIGRVVVTTDDEAIAGAARAAGAETVARPAELAGCTATSESAVLHALEALGATATADAADAAVTDAITVFIQATSPFIDPADLDAAIETVARDERDVVFSATPSHVFLWRGDAGGDTVGVNHDAAHRPRRQDREPEYAETGAFYVMRTGGFVRHGHRFFGRVGIQRVNADHAIEIDDAADLARANALARAIDLAPLHPLPLIDVDAVVTDFDGVHTDDTVMVDELGRETVRVGRSDGYGIARLRAAGVPVLILSAEENPVVARRAEKLGVECAQGIAEKGSVLREWAALRGIRLDRIAYLGNDHGDLPALSGVGWPIAVADAAPAVLDVVRHVLVHRGGSGAVRELADLVLAARASDSATEQAALLTDPTFDTSGVHA
ncbi:acylneuraminate cytidylyltransferase [Agromyces laixinhei]|uniref:acylneuraminate cytidylyltransferase n=1 Tax=Agromyces laixinhei TaxID=2585717 RepID=UPI0012EDBB3E|nr:acylneuraminate cytidylyltransferase [Agromyces laixinhei]